MVEIGNKPYLIAVTGAQGVGKSTFCARLVTALDSAVPHDVYAVGGLRKRMEALGLPFGSASITETIPAVFASHLERDREFQAGIAVLDRCTIDALAYARCLNLAGPMHLRLYEAVTSFNAQAWSLVIHLELSTFFEQRGGDHETPELRLRVADEVSKIVDQLRRPTISVDAARPNAVELAATAVLAAISAE